MDFKRAAEIAKNHIKEWLPDGHIERDIQWVCASPSHPDEKHIGNFSVNIETGAFYDFADPDFCGHDAVSLYARMHGLSNFQAAEEILLKYDASYFPDNNGKSTDAEYWYQCTKGRPDAPELPEKYHGSNRWPLEIKVGDKWRVVMWITRYKFEDEVNADGKPKKTDCPYTLWTDSKSYEWRKGAIKGSKYPLYGLRNLIEHPNKRVVLYEGQKTAWAVQPILGDDWVCVGWYGGAGNSKLTDFEPLSGREVWYCFDADGAGRKAITPILENVHAKIHLVYPPSDVPKGWDHADAVKQGYTKEQLEELLLSDSNTKPAPLPPTPVINVPDKRPSSLDKFISDDYREQFLSSMFHVAKDKDGQDKTVITDNWQIKILDYDPIIGNSIKYDYTTGISATAYDNNNLYIGALENRLFLLGIKSSYVTKVNVEKIQRAVLNKNSNFNRVTDYIDALSDRYPRQSESVLDDFMNLFDFDVQREEEESGGEYDERVAYTKKMYRELFDKFFTRMHGHINGTRRVEGEYKGLIENDIVPILSGPQGCGKTTLCRWIACDDELYIDLGSGLKSSFGSAETSKKIRGKLLVELGEMSAMKNAKDVETIKSFVSSPSADIDIKYVENAKKIPVTASFFGTDNNGQYLTDDTGNRRFWPILIKSLDVKKMADSDINYRLHAYYAQKTKLMSTQEIKDYCNTKGTELENFADSMRKEALVTYSDYEACLEVIAAWKPTNKGNTLNQANIERLAVEAKYMGRISSKSCKRALKDSGLIQIRRKSELTGQYTKMWIWNGDEKTDLPF